MAKFELTTFTPPVKDDARAKEWAEPVAQLDEATKAWEASEDRNPNEVPAIKAAIAIADEAKELRGLRKAAEAIGRTVRIRHRDDSSVVRAGEKENGKAIYSGDVVLTVSLSEKYKDGRGRKTAPAESAKTEGKAKA